MQKQFSIACFKKNETVSLKLSPAAVFIIYFHLTSFLSKVMKKLCMEPPDRLSSLQILWENNKPAEPGPCGMNLWLLRASAHSTVQNSSATRYFFIVYFHGARLAACHRNPHVSPVIKSMKNAKDKSFTVIKQHFLTNKVILKELTWCMSVMWDLTVCSVSLKTE